VIETFAALSEPSRFRIVELLPQVSKHLRVLKEAGLVDVEARAQQRMYELRPQPLRRLHRWLERYREIWDARFEQLDELIAELKEEENAHGRNRHR